MNVPANLANPETVNKTPIDIIIGYGCLFARRTAKQMSDTPIEMLAPKSARICSAVF